MFLAIHSFYNIINWRDTTHIDSEDDYCTGCRNVSHRQEEESYTVLLTFIRMIIMNLLMIVFKFYQILI